MKPENPNLAKLIWGTAVFSIFFIILGAGILIFLPEERISFPHGYCRMIGI